MARIKRDDWVALLRKLWLFDRCSTRELIQLASLMTLVGVPAGTVMAHEGETGNECFVIVDGTASITRANRELGTLGPGTFFGEMALLDGGPRVTTATAVTPMTLLVMTRGEFERLIQSAMPSVARKMILVLSARLRQVDIRLAPNTTQKAAALPPGV